MSAVRLTLRRLALAWFLLAALPGARAQSFHGKKFHILSKVDGSALTALEARSHGKVGMRPFRGGADQSFLLTADASGHYVVTLLGTDLALDVPGSSNGDGTRLQLYAKHGQANQQMRLTGCGDGFYHVTVAHSGKAWDVGEQALFGSPALSQRSFDGYFEQQFDFVEIQPAQDVRPIFEAFRDYDLDGDGTDEITRIEPAPFEGAHGHLVSQATPLVLVLIEPRLLQPIVGGPSSAQLQQKLSEWLDHMRRDGLRPYAVTADVYGGSEHQDGRTLLALRRMLRSVDDACPNLQGAILVGAFPEAMLVRRWIWRHDGWQVTINGVTYNRPDGPKSSWLGIVPEIVADRSDIVLADLDGKWESIYRQPATPLESISALPAPGSGDAWPSSTQVFRSHGFKKESMTFEDFFWLRDDRYEIVSETAQELVLELTPPAARLEVADSERRAANPIATPDIAVSRINPWHVGVQQAPQYLDANGLPQAAPATPGVYPNHQFTRDPGMERRLLIDYLDRNIAHRVGALTSTSFRAARVSSALSTFSENYGVASDDMGATVTFADASVLDFVRFLATPAIVKTISAHSNSSSSSFEKDYSQPELAAATGGHYWYWVGSGDQVVPTYDHANVRKNATFALFRTLWRNRVLRDTPSSFFVHGGCQVNSPGGHASAPYSSPAYASHGQLAENHLFYGNGLGLLTRSKVFYDAPRGFSKAFGAPGGRFGDTLAAYAMIESADAQLSSSIASFNRSYFWSILGDWSLRLDYRRSDTDAVVELYPHSEFRGEVLRLGVGKYDVATLHSSLGNDTVSSVRVAPGFWAVLHMHAGFNEPNLVLKGGDWPDLSQYETDGVSFNDQVSSLEIVPMDQGGVTLYRHRDYGGESISFGVGRHDVAALANTIGNDQLSSVRVAEGFRVRLFAHKGFEGAVCALDRDTPMLENFNDVTSSFVIEFVP